MRAQLEFLLEDYRSIKSEIARRSNLQRIALAGYVTLIAVLIRLFLTQNQVVIATVGIWAASAFTLLFYEREHLEISRLGHLVRDRISPAASRSMGGNIRCSELLPSEAGLEAREDLRARLYDDIFFIGLFLILPLGITGYSLLLRWSGLEAVCGNWRFWVALIGSLTALCTNFFLLKRRFAGSALD